MSAKRNLLAGVTTAILAVAGVAWAADLPDSKVEVTNRTLVPVDGVGTVTLEVVGDELSLVSAAPEDGWTVVVERSIGREVEARFDGAGGLVRFDAELEDGEIRVEIERTSSSSSSSTTSSPTSSSSTTSLTSPSTTSSTSPASTTSIVTSTSIPVASTSTTVGGSSTSTTIDSSTSTTVDATTSTTFGSTSTTIDDDGPLNLPDGTRTYQAGTAGSIAIQISGGWLSLASVNANPGWSHEVDKNRPDDVEVEFHNGDDEVKIRVRNHDGQLEVRVEAD